MTDTRSSDPAAVQSALQFLMALHFINWLGFAGWNALLHNYTIERSGFGWFEAGITQTCARSRASSPSRSSSG